jgi:Uma2 family endonuclease
MRAVMCEVPQKILDWRRRTGGDKLDEMWEGVLHMVPAPNIDHQEFEGELEAWFRTFWVAKLGGRVLHNVNVSHGEDWRDDYRIPDLILLLPTQLNLLRETHIQGPPSLVVEIRSPNDETHEKFSFYAALGVPEVLVVDRDSKVPQRHVLEQGRYRMVEGDDQGWLVSPEVGVEYRSAGNALFAIRLIGAEHSYRELPIRS